MWRVFKLPTDQESDLELFSGPREKHFDANRIGENSLNEKNIQEVLEIEKQADAIHAAALHEAQQIPVQAEQEAQALIEKARASAKEEARKILDNAQAAEESARILRDAENQIKRTDGLARKNFDRAVSYVMSRVIGREW
jgi:vacuolar-type H+-ATPase subunit H